MTDRRDPGDPFGRRAFFSQPLINGSQEPGPPLVDAADEGRRARFAKPDEAPAPVAAGPASGAAATVECRTCLARTPMPIGAAVMQLVPSLWLPGRPWSRLMRCPNCRKVSWCRVRWREAAKP